MVYSGEFISKYFQELHGAGDQEGVFKNYTVQLFGTQAIAYKYFGALILIKKRQLRSILELSSNSQLKASF
jgi:hypothetical protein